MDMGHNGMASSEFNMGAPRVLDFTPTNFGAALAALDEEYRQKREAIAHEVLGKLVARESVLVDELRELRAQKDEIQRQCGVALPLPQDVNLPRPFVRRRSRIDDKARIDAVDVTVIPARQAPKPTVNTMDDAIRYVLSGGEKMGKKAIIDTIMDMGLHFKRDSLAAHIPTIRGIRSEKDTALGAHPAARVYWLETAKS